MTQRQYPVCPSADGPARRPVSFVVVRFCNEIEHNFLASECAASELNEVIEVDNRGNIFFDNLSMAIVHGVARANHELIAIVHEDVKLPDGWQARFERSLEALEAHDGAWGLLGSVGWSKAGGVVGHYSDPHVYINTFSAGCRPFAKVRRLDEQLMIIHRDRKPAFDEHMPGIHNLGRELAAKLGDRGMQTYAIDAPTIHKFKDRFGRIVTEPGGSEKIRDRETLTYRADKACCDDYFSRKRPEWNALRPNPDEFHVPLSSAAKLAQLQRPVILLSRGGSGSRLLSMMVEDAGVFLGNELNRSGDSLEMVVPLYRAIIEKFACHADWQKQQPVARILAAAARMIKDITDSQPWGFKLPESIFVLPELTQTFPQARFVHLIRDPISTCLRRTHMTARLDNHIGRITLPLAYDSMGWPRRKILEDHPAEHAACSVTHQLSLVASLRETSSPQQFFELRFEDIIAHPRHEMSKLCDWLGLDAVGCRIVQCIDPGRANGSAANIPDSVVRQVTNTLAAVRERENYTDT